MDTGKSNTIDNKVDFLMKDCRKLVEYAEEITQCPVCFENTDQIMEQCTSGHLICLKCKGKIYTNSCPFCKKIYSGTKSFIMPDLSKTLSSLKISLDELEINVIKSNIEKPINEAYRNLIKTILSKMSSFLNNTNDTFQMLGNYLHNPNYISKNEMEKQMLLLTTQLHNVKYFMDVTKDTLISLKK